MSENQMLIGEGVELGLRYCQEYSIFTVWAPTASQVETIIYTNQGSCEVESAEETSGETEETEEIYESYLMEANDGIWQVSILRDLEGTYYQYKVTFEDGTVNYARDPYSIAVSANGHRSAVVDLKKTDPANWEQVKYLKTGGPVESVIMELHVRDFSMSDTVQFQYPGKFMAFTEDGLETPGGHSAGIESLVDLGITHIQIQPVYDFAYVDECRVDDKEYDGRKFNWGYDPVNYNVPEGSYSANPRDPYSRIREMKEMIAALHRRNIGIIMDVVYNHTQSIENGPFQKIVPDYFYRKNADGSFASGSGCGNELASEKPMVRKYIYDSVKYWATEYGIDGFRFDLMGLIDTDTVEYITQKLREEVRPEIIIYGEPWQAGGSPLSYEKQTLKGSQKNKGFGVFNDNLRTAIKGSNKGHDGAYVIGRPGFEYDIAEGVYGSIHTIAANPSETVNYVTAHDDLNLWDKIAHSYYWDKLEGFVEIEDGALKYGGSVEDAVKAATLHHSVIANRELENLCVKSCLLANAIILTSQGIPYFHAGDEFLRSKYGDGNSYRSPDCINAIRWTDKDDFYQVFQYYQGMIALRKAHKAFQMTLASEVEAHLMFYQKWDGVICFGLNDHANNDLWKQIIVIYNNNSSSRMVGLPCSANWRVVMDAEKAGTSVLRKFDGGSVLVDGVSAMVLYTM